jgi:lipoprotein NlpD
MSARQPMPGRTAAALAALALVACAVSSTKDAPIVERSQATGAPRAAASPTVAPAARSAPPAAREAHDGVYVVQSGDTLYSIALAFGQDYREIARWNAVDPVAHLQVGQALRVAPPPAQDSGAAEAIPVPVAPTATVESHLLAPAESPAPPPSAASEAPQRPSVTASGTAAAAPTATGPAPAAEPDSTWAWPGTGKVLARFDEAQNKGIDIAGNVGDPVWAANDGQVVYSGNGLRDYGKLIIIKHTDDYVSVYAHNNEILVTQGQAVKRGQRIADLGMTGAPTPRLHFEIRRRGTPVDPLTYLPSR